MGITSIFIFKVQDEAVVSEVLVRFSSRLKGDGSFFSGETRGHYVQLVAIFADFEVKVIVTAKVMVRKVLGLDSCMTCICKQHFFNQNNHATLNFNKVPKDLYQCRHTRLWICQLNMQCA